MASGKMLLGDFLARVGRFPRLHFRRQKVLALMEFLIEGISNYGGASFWQFVVRGHAFVGEPSRNRVLHRMFGERKTGDAKLRQVLERSNRSVELFGLADPASRFVRLRH